jgi:PKD repeat protein
VSLPHHRLLLSIVLLASLSLSIAAFTPVVPVAHALTEQLLIQPASLPLATAGSTVTFNVAVANMPTFAGWDIYVRTTPSILDPTAFTLGTFLPAGFESIHCINGGILNANTACDANDGPGIVHSGFASFGFGAGSGTLFTITYSAVAGPGTTVAFPEAATTNNGLNSLFDTSGANFTGVSEVGGTYGSLANPTTTVVNCGTSAVVAGASVTCSATVTDTSTTPSTPSGTVGFISSGAGTFSGSPCTLAGTLATSTCSATYSPSAVGSQTITGTYSGDATHSTSFGTATVTVIAALVADFTSAPAAPTVGATVSFTPSVSGGTTPYAYSWTFGDGGTSTVSNPTHAYATAGTFAVALTVTDSSTPHQTKTANHSVSVSAGLTAAFTTSPANPIIGGIVTFTSTVTGGTTPFVYAWTFGDGGTSTVANPTHSYTTAGPFTVSLTVTDSSVPAQTATVSHTVTVASPEVADFTSAPANPVIAGTLTFTSTVTGGTTPYVYSWTFGDSGTSTLANPTHAYTTAGTFTVTLTVTDSSTPTQSKTASHTVTVASALVADFTSSPAAPTTGQTVSFTSTVSGGTVPYTYSWSFGDTGTSNVANPTHIYLTGGTFTVTLIVSDSSTPAQSKTATHTVTISSPLAADFTSSPAAPGVGTTVTFTSTVTGGATPYTYSWTFGDGATSTVANPTRAYTTAGTFTVTLTVTDSSTPTQSKVATHSVSVSTGLAADFTSSPAHPIIGGTVTFTSTVTGGTTPYTYSWSFGDGGTSSVANPTHSYATAGSFTVTLTVTDSSTPAQSRTASHTIVVASAVTADFTSTPSGPTAGQTVTFTSTVSGGTTPYTYSWNFGDGGTSNVANPTHAYSTAGTFTVTLTVTDSSTPAQTATPSHTVTVSTGLAADFTSSPAHPVIGGTVTFTSTVTGGKTPFVYAWTFGDGGTSSVANPTHAYATSGSFSVTLVVTDSSTPAQSSTASHTVTVASALAGGFTASPSAPTIGQTVTFTSTVSGGTIPYSYSWTFGDSGTSTLANPTHAYATAGTFTVTLIVTDSSTPAQSVTATHSVTISAKLAADFTFSPTSPTTGQTVTFTSTVSGGTTPYAYSWTFGDGATSAVANPTHAYATAGTFTVTLTVTDSSTPAQSATASHTVTVSGPLTADFTSSPSAPIIGGTVTFTSTVAGGTGPSTYSWTFGDSGTSNIANPTHAYATAGTFTVTLTVTDSSTPTQSATRSHTVTVASALAADFTFSPTAPTTGQTVSFTSTVTGGTTPYVYAWTFGDGGTSNVANPTHSYSTAGTFTVTLTVTDSSTPAQSATRSHSVAVSAGLAADFTSSPAHPVISGTVTFTSTVTGGTTPFVYSWTFGDSGTSAIANPTHAYVTSGTFTVTLTVTDSSTPAQSRTASHTVTVASAVTADFTFSPTAPTTSQTVTFTSTVTGGTTPYTYSWMFGDGGTSTVANPTHSYATAGTFTVTLMVTDSSTPTQSSTATHSVTVTVVVNAVTIKTTLSQTSISVGGSVSDSATLSGNTATATGTVTYYLFNSADCTGTSTVVSSVTVAAGVVPNSASQTFNTAGSFSWNAVYSGDANNSVATSACEPLTVSSQTAKPVLLTFQGFDIDDFDNGVGQLQVFVNGHLVVNVPPGTGTGDNSFYTNEWVSFGPFVITNDVVQGQNNITFVSPAPGHFGLVKNVTITQNNVVLLHVRGVQFVSLFHQVKFTFSIPPLVLTSFVVSNAAPATDQSVTFTAAYTGGTGPFKCVFRFGDGESASVVGAAGVCSVTHHYDDSGTFAARVEINGASTSDRVSSPSTRVTVGNDDNGSTESSVPSYLQTTSLESLDEE